MAEKYFRFQKDRGFGTDRPLRERRRWSGSRPARPGSAVGGKMIEAAFWADALGFVCDFSERLLSPPISIHVVSFLHSGNLLETRASR